MNTLLCPDKSWILEGLFSTPVEKRKPLTMRAADNTRKNEFLSAEFSQLFKGLTHKIV